MATTNLFVIAKIGTLEEFRKYYDKARLNEQNKYGFSFLHNAIANSKYDIADFLLDEGIDVNLQDSDRCTALHYIVEQPTNENIIRIVKKLLKNGADINMQDKEGNTPLIAATAKSNGAGLERFKLLLHYNPDINIKNKYGRSCKSIAEQIRDMANIHAPYAALQELKLV